MAAIGVGWSSIDLGFRRLLLLSKLFTTSWGNPKALEKMFAFRKSVMGKGAIMEVIERMQPKMIITKEEVRKETRYLEGCFKSPYAWVFPEMMPDNIGWATWRGIFPKKLRRALVIHLAGTGDHSFFRREWGFANNLLKQGVSSILLENPFYGSRKPKNQFRSSLNNVSDLFVMGGALMAECNFLLKWAKQMGYCPLGLCGVSMGGHMVSLACTNSPDPVAVVPCLSWTTAAPVFVEGALSGAIPWETLTMEFRSKKFQSAINQIPQCDWIERAHEMEKRLGRDCAFGMAKQFMYVLMEEFTNLGNYPKPVDTTLVKNVIAENDAYIVRSGTPSLQELWPGSNVEMLKGAGHVYAYLVNHGLFRKCIMEMLSRTERLYCQR
uniref:AB hydrolase-1 domain-containing protein n=2 Tax=Ascaris TaxID=6251 RepID=A0A9J2P7A9_ASCLU